MVQLVTSLPVTQMPGVRFPVAEDLIIIFKISRQSVLNQIYIYIWVRSSVVEHGIADPMVAGSIPVTPFRYIECIYPRQSRWSGYQVFTLATRVRFPDEECLLHIEYNWKLWRNWQRVGFQTRRLGVRLPLASAYIHTSIYVISFDMRAWSSWL